MHDSDALPITHVMMCCDAGSSLQAQATAMGFPSSQLASATAADPSASAPVNHAILAESVSSIVGFCGFAAILLGEASLSQAQALLSVESMTAPVVLRM